MTEEYVHTTWNSEDQFILQPVAHSTGDPISDAPLPVASQPPCLAAPHVVKNPILEITINFTVKLNYLTAYLFMSAILCTTKHL